MVGKIYRVILVKLSSEKEKDKTKDGKMDD